MRGTRFEEWLSGSWLNNWADIVDIYTGKEEIDSGTFWGLGGIKSSVLFEMVVRHLMEM